MADQGNAAPRRRSRAARRRSRYRRPQADRPRRPGSSCGVAIAWSLFQLWYASPLPFVFGFGIFNDTEARVDPSRASRCSSPSRPIRRSSRRRATTSRPSTGCWRSLAPSRRVLYLFLFYRELALRPGLPTTFDLVTAVRRHRCCCSKRRAARTARGCRSSRIVFLFYVSPGPTCPSLMRTRARRSRASASHFWLTTEGVFGVALGVSTSFVFLFVLFGTLLEKAGAGNWFIQISFALLGHLRGGPGQGRAWCPPA